VKILLVEDHEEQANMLCRLLTQKMDCECVIANTLAEGLEESRRGADITILDLHLVGSSILDTIKSIPKFPKPVIVITEMDDPGKKIELLCYAYEAENFFSKNFLHRIIEDMPGKGQKINGEGSRLISAVTGAYFRTTLPARREELLQSYLDAR
jgi:CheY-like chemotaxis protein